MIGNLIVILKYIIAIALIAIIVLAPAWMATQTKKDKTDTVMVRFGSWLLGWTVIGWLWSLFHGSKK
ncbi:MAG: hypothetical protein K2M34_01730 [Alphaproteobacteria bacterium]|nr:hypothetical protein [Alphaproteobacteria bacterium]